MKILLEITIMVGLNFLLFGYVERRLLLRVTTLSQQLGVCMRRKEKPRLKERDRLFWMLLSRIWPEWKSALVIVRPETVLKWNRERFRRYWRRISDPRGKVGRPKIPREHIEFIRKISTDHPEYSAERIAGILRENFGVHHAKSTVDRYRVETPWKPRGDQTWRTFLKNHASAIWCCDFMVQLLQGLHRTGITARIPSCNG